MSRIHLRPMRTEDGRSLSAAFAALGWTKPEAQYRGYVAEQRAGTRWTCVAEIDEIAAGYVTLVWDSEDPAFAEATIPEVVDLNVLPAFRRRGVATALMEAAELEAATRSSMIGLRVGLHSGYGAAQRLYVRRGYLPDGSGAVRCGEVVPEEATVPLDDDTTLRMTKRLEGPEAH